MTDYAQGGPGTLPGAVRSVMLIADDAVLAARADEAIAIAGARVTARLGWSAAPAALDACGPVDALLLEAAQVEADRLVVLLPVADLLARRHGAGLIVALAEPQIDLVAAHVFGAHAQLLCAPSVAERVAALLSGEAVQGVRDKAGEAESERLQRLNEEVARIAETLARLTRREPEAVLPQRPAGLVGDRTLGYGAPPSLEAASSVSAPQIRQAIRARRLRDQFFSGTLFEDPAWDMLLDLFAAELEGTRVSVSSLCIAAAVAPTTALRWISKMSQAALLERQPDPFDRRRAYMALSAEARAGLQDYFAACRRLGLAVG